MFEYVKESHTPPVYSLFIPFTREATVDDFLRMLDGLAMPLQEMEFVFYNDTDNMTLQGKLRNYLSKKDKLATAKLYCSRNLPPTETNAQIRRDRIVDMKNKSRELIGNSQYVICLEDDTYLEDRDAIYKLVTHIGETPNAAFVSGVERGRWGFSIIGAWKVHPLSEPTNVHTLPYRESGLQAVDGAGWYFYITDTKLYKEAEYRYEAECLGPDVCYVLDLRRKGYDCYVDWSIVCGHRHGGAMLYPDDKCMSVEWTKYGQDWIITKILNKS